MNTQEITERVWFTIPTDKIIEQLKIPGMRTTFLQEYWKLNPQSFSDAVLVLAREEIKKRDADVAVLAAVLPSVKTEKTIEVLLLIGGTEKEFEKIAGFEKPFDWRMNPIEHEAPTQYELIRESAFNLLRKQEVKNLSEDELWRAVKYTPNSGLYLAIIRREIQGGLTIKKLYAGRDRGLER